jgi:AI-2 transport protein TqsA
LLAFITSYIPNLRFVKSAGAAGTIGPAAGQTQADGQRRSHVLGDQLRLPAEDHGRRCQPLAHADLPVTGLLGFVIGLPGAVVTVPPTLLTKALLLDVDPSTRWISSLFTGGSAPSEDAFDDAAPTPVTSDPPDGDGPRPPAVERVTDIG